MKMEVARKAGELRFAITQQEIEVRNIENALKECEKEETELYWTAYGGLGLVDGWGRRDVQRALDRAKLKLKALEKKLEDL